MCLPFTHPYLVLPEGSQPFQFSHQLSHLVSGQCMLSLCSLKRTGSKILQLMHTNRLYTEPGCMIQHWTNQVVIFGP